MPAPLHGQVSITGSAQALSSTVVSVSAFTIKAPKSNANPVYIGSSTVTTSNGHQLDAGDEFEYECLDQNGQPRYSLRPSDFYAVGTAGTDKVTWLGSPA